MPRKIDPAKEARRVAIKRAQERARYHARSDVRAQKLEKNGRRRRDRARLLELDPTMTCTGLALLAEHECEGPMECHHRDGNWRNGADANLSWACRRAHEQFDALLGV